MKLLRTGLKIITKGDGTKIYEPFGVFETGWTLGLFPRTETSCIKKDWRYKDPQYYFTDDGFSFITMNENEALEVLDLAVKRYLETEKWDEDTRIVKEEIKILKQY